MPENSGSYGAVVKITPSNQTLILASERRGPGNPSGGSSTKTASAGSTVLQRVTIVAAQPDSTVVYLRADYATAGGGAPTIYGGRSAAGSSYTADAEFTDSPTAGSTSSSVASPTDGAPRAAAPGAALVVRPQTGVPGRDAYGNVLGGRRDTGISSYLPPVEQYAQTQRLVGVAPTVQRIDVHA